MTGWASAAFDGVTRDRAGERLKANRARLTDLGKQLRQDLAEAANVPDPEDLSPEGLAKQVAFRQDQVRRRLGGQITQVRSEIATDLDAVRRDADRVRPKVGDDALSLQRAQVKWDQVRMRLEAGMTIQNVLAGADRDTAMAIREWAPAWMEAQAFAVRPQDVTHLGHQAPDPSALLRSIDARLAEVEGGQVAKSLSALRAAEAAAAGAWPVVEHLESVVHGADPSTGGLDAALASQFATQQAVAVYGSQDAEATEAVAADAGAGA